MGRAGLAGSLISGAFCLALAGCAHGGSVTVGSGDPHDPHGHERDVHASGPGRGHGPPPHAPAHGYRTKQNAGVADVELVFDSGLGVYVVVGLPDHFFWDGFFLRSEKGLWYSSLRIDGGWEPRSSDALPPGLRNKTAIHKVKKGRGPAKRGW
jgi:hypothetical protein